VIKDSIDIQPPYARKKRVFIAKHQNRPDSNYIQERHFNQKGLIERETWKLDNGQEIIDLDDAQYISQSNAEELKMQTLEPSALMKLAKQKDYYGNKGQMCVLYNNKIYYSSIIIEIIPPLREDFEPEYDISQDFEDFKKS
jgi:tRNA U34 2-thiouridine synthase MnmA/TrmU